MAGLFTELTTGLRGGVICALQWDNLNPKTGELQVERQVHRVRGELMASPPKNQGMADGCAPPLPAGKLMTPAGQSRRSHDFFCLWLVLGANLWQKQFEKNQPIQNLRH